jgi:hypothetical protein
LIRIGTRVIERSHATESHVSESSSILCTYSVKLDVAAQRDASIVK